MKNIRFFWGKLLQVLRWLWNNLILRRYDRRRWYRDVYLNSGHWHAFRKIVVKFYGSTCQQKECLIHWPLDIHHKHYKTIGRERVQDVTLLCRYHHTLIEEGYSIILKNGTVLKGYKKREYNKGNSA